MSGLTVSEDVENNFESPVDLESPSAEEQSETPIADPPVPPKRKGGRKPIYATSEERKQRNRQAQAAFRERRTEYIKQLEISAKETEDTLESLRANKRELSDECNMLRYKTTLLEELLDEHGIDYRTQLQAKSNRSLLGRSERSRALNSGRRVGQVTSHSKTERPDGPNLHSLKQSGSRKGSFSTTARDSIESSHSSVPSPSTFTFPSISTSTGGMYRQMMSDNVHRPSSGDLNMAQQASLLSHGHNAMLNQFFMARENISNGYGQPHGVNHRHVSSYELIPAAVSPVSEIGINYLVQAQPRRLNSSTDQALGYSTFESHFDQRPASYRSQDLGYVPAQAFDYERKYKRHSHPGPLPLANQAVQFDGEQRFDYPG